MTGYLWILLVAGCLWLVHRAVEILIDACMGRLFWHQAPSAERRAQLTAAAGVRRRP